MAAYAKNWSVVGQIIDWNKNWLMMGGLVACTECLEFQSVEYLGEPFKHASNCSRFNEPEENPWISLEGILNWSVGQASETIGSGH